MIPFVFVCGHMRSGSSLLTRILVSNPQVEGFGENHICYRHTTDLDVLRSRIDQRVEFEASDFANSRGTPIVLDKILHDHLEVCDELLQNTLGRFVFLIREPRSSIASMMMRYPDWFTGKPVAKIDLFRSAAAYYESRIKDVLYMACRIRDSERMFFLTFDELVYHTSAVFTALEMLLGLRTPLSEEYRPPNRSRSSEEGDNSDQILAGRIIRHRKPPTITSDHSGLLRLERTYVTVCRLMRDRCRHVEID